MVSRRRSRGTPARLLVLAALLSAACVAAKPRVRVGSDLDGVPDSEEDDAWREWGKRREPKKIEGAGPARASERAPPC